MKLAILLMAAVSASAQSNLTQTISGDKSILTLLRSPAQPIKDASFLVEYITREKCFECGVRYAMVCGGEDSDCNIPYKDVQHFAPFATEREAFDFLNHGMTGEFVRLLRVSAVPVNVVKSTREVPQPPKVEETTEYSARGQK